MIGYLTNKVLSKEFKLCDYVGMVNIASLCIAGYTFLFYATNESDNILKLKIGLEWQSILGFLLFVIFDIFIYIMCIHDEYKNEFIYKYVICTYVLIQFVSDGDFQSRVIIPLQVFMWIYIIKYMFNSKELIKKYILVSCFSISILTPIGDINNMFVHGVLANTLHLPVDDWYTFENQNVITLPLINQYTVFAPWDKFYFRKICPIENSSKHSLIDWKKEEETMVIKKIVASEKTINEVFEIGDFTAEQEKKLKYQIENSSYQNTQFDIENWKIKPKELLNYDINSRKIGLEWNNQKDIINLDRNLWLCSVSITNDGNEIIYAGDILNSQNGYREGVCVSIFDSKGELVGYGTKFLDNYILPGDKLHMLVKVSKPKKDGDMIARINYYKCDEQGNLSQVHNNVMEYKIKFK